MYHMYHGQDVGWSYSWEDPDLCAGTNEGVGILVCNKYSDQVLRGKDIHLERTHYSIHFTYHHNCFWENMQLSSLRNDWDVRILAKFRQEDSTWPPTIIMVNQLSMNSKGNTVDPEQCGFELLGPTYTRIFLDSKHYSTTVHGWLTPQMWRNQGCGGPDVSFMWINPGVVQESTIVLNKRKRKKKIQLLFKISSRSLGDFYFSILLCLGCTEQGK